MDLRLTPARDQVVRLQDLVQSQGRLLTQGIVNHSDEAALAPRRYQFLTGPSGIWQTLKQVSSQEGKCWRHKPSDRRPAEMSLALLREGFGKANNDFLELRLEARSRVAYNQ